MLIYLGLSSINRDTGAESTGKDTPGGERSKKDLAADEGNIKDSTADESSKISQGNDLKEDGEMKPEPVDFVKNGFSCTFDKKTGKLIKVSYNGMEISMDGLMIDVGCNGYYKNGFLIYQSFEDFNTWELPRIDLAGAETTAWEFLGFTESDDSIIARVRVDTLEIDTIYSFDDNNLKVSTQITNTGDKDALFNGVAFIVKGVKVDQDSEFDFPASVPHDVFHLSKLKQYSVVETGLVSPVVHTRTGDEHLNLIFLNPDEKWATGVYKDEDENLNYVFIAAVESTLVPHETLECGDLFIQPVGQGDYFKPIRDLYAQNGWVPPRDGITDGPLYSCHPYGTMDIDFSSPKTLIQYAEELKTLHEMGIQHIWLLPIFDHAMERGVYAPYDQSVIAPRYGGDEGVKYFVEEAHKLGMNVLFDYVPHGPYPDDPLAIEHRDWCSKRRDGSLQIEWNCVSFDMANPEYQEYTKNLVKDHIRRFNIDGARIDCAMGGLSNWEPYEGNRPSNSNLKGGVSISKAIRDAFVEMGKRPLITPENFNPVPFYFPYTDAFYDMPLYRVFVELEDARLSEKEYAAELVRWLNAELLSTPKGLLKLRFLGNHDTVTWVWQKARPVKVYGVEKAKALWALITFIDGIPMIYQGDEDPTIYRGTGPDLKEFFKGIFTARKEWLGNDYDIEYIFTDSPIVAFRRFKGDQTRLVLINLSKDKQRYEIDMKGKEIVFGEGKADGNGIVLEGYKYVIINCKE